MTQDWQQKAAGEIEDDHDADIIMLTRDFAGPELMTKDDAHALVIECKRIIHGGTT